MGSGAATPEAAAGVNRVGRAPSTGAMEASEGQWRVGRRGWCGALLGAAAGVGLLGGPVSRALALGRGSRAPDIGLSDLEGKRVTLADLAGKVVLVDFWASWCKPCREEMPVLEKLHRKYGPDGLVIVGVSVDKELAKAREFVARTKVSFRVVHDPEHQVAGRYAPAKMPTSYLIDKGGVVRFVHEGFDAEDAAKFPTEIESLLAK